MSLVLLGGLGVAIALELERGALTIVAILSVVLAAGTAVHLTMRRERLRFLERAWNAERKARLLQAEQARLLEAVHDPVIVIDVAQRIRFWNGGAERVYGWVRDEVVGRGIGEVLQTEYRGANAEEQYRLLEAAGALRLEVSQRRKDGSTIEVEIAAVAVREPDGALAGYLSVSRDLTAQRQADEARRGMQARLLEADRMASMGLLAASVAHELANPIAYVLSNVRYVREELSRPAPHLDEIREALQEAAEGSERVRRIVADVKTFSRASDGAAARAEVAPVIESAIRIAAAELRHRARVAIDVPSLPAVAMTAHRLGQVLLNLVVNAAQAVAAGDPEHNEVRVAAWRDGAAVAIEVSDTGAGVPDAVRARLFEPFFTTKPVGVGTGLGLAICRRLVSEAAGTLELASPPGRGATFRLRLPVAATGVPTPGRGSVLVVDDEAKVARVLARGLEADHDVHVETDPERALARLTAGEDFDVVLCDVMMPRLDGRALFERAVIARPEVAERFVFVTGAEREGDGLAITGRPVIAKPFDLATVRAMVQGRIRASRAVPLA